MSSPTNPLRAEIRDMPIKGNKDNHMYFWERDLLNWMGASPSDPIVSLLSEAVAKTIGGDIAATHFQEARDNEGNFSGVKLDGVGSLLTISELFAANGTRSQDIQLLIRQGVLITLAAGVAHRNRQSAYSIEQRVRGKVRIKDLITDFVAGVNEVFTEALSRDWLVEEAWEGVHPIRAIGNRALFGEKTTKKVPKLNCTPERETFIDQISVVGMAARGLQMAATARVARSRELVLGGDLEEDLLPNTPWDGEPAPLTSHYLQLEHAHAHSGQLIKTRLRGFEDPVNLEKLKGEAADTALEPV